MEPFLTPDTARAVGGAAGAICPYTLRASTAEPHNDQPPVRLAQPGDQGNPALPRERGYLKATDVRSSRWGGGGGGESERIRAADEGWVELRDPGAARRTGLPGGFREALRS